MPKRSKNRSSKNGQTANQQVKNALCEKFFSLLPQPRLPSWVGSNDRLNARESAYPDMVKLDCPITIQKQSIVAGALGANFNVSSSLINNFATRFGALFNEYAIVGARLELRVTNVVNPAGLYIVSLDEISSSVPTTTILDQPHIEKLITAAEDPSAAIIEWKAHDFFDETWTAVGSNPVPFTLKFYASSSTGTTVTTTADILVSGALAMCFRGYKLT